MAGFNWHTVAGYGVLLVECKGCGRRGAIDKEGARRRMHQGNMGEINREYGHPGGRSPCLNPIRAQ